jgi:hypothetical protein
MRQVTKPLIDFFNISNLLKKQEQQFASECKMNIINSWLTNQKSML